MDAVNGFRCVCPTGFEGSVCERNVDDCRGNPCLNGARCIDAVNNFRCECDVGFEGVLCETNVDDCTSSPCLNGGTCHDLVGDIACQCAPGFLGPRCADVVPPRDNASASPGVGRCRERPCLNGATCIPLSDGGHLCHCVAGYAGHDCGDVVGTVTPAAPVVAPSLTLDSSYTLLQLALIGGLGIGLPLTVVLLTAVVVVVVRRRRRIRRKRLERSRSAIFINNRHPDNLSSSSSSINNAVALRQNRANTALMSAASATDCCRDDKTKSVCAVDVDADGDMCRGDRVNSSSRGNASGCSYIKLTNHQPQQHQRHSYDPNIYHHHQQQQQQQQQQYLLHPSHYHSRHHHSLLSQVTHHTRPPPPNRHHHQHHHRHSNVCRSTFVDDFDISSVVDPLKSLNDDRFSVNVVQPASGDAAGCSYGGCRAYRADDDVSVDF